MRIDDTIRVLTEVRRLAGEWVPRAAACPDALIADLNRLYAASAENGDFRELFEHDDVGSPSITLVVGINEIFDLQAVVSSMRTQLDIGQPGKADEIGNTGIVWSCGRYDFVYDRNSGCLRISHMYSHERSDARSVSSIAKQMIDYAIDYLKAVKDSGGVSKTDCDPTSG